LSNLVKSLPWLSGASVLLIAISSFVLSYSSLYSLAIEAGFSPYLAPLWPLGLDLLMIASSITILSRTVTGESTSLPWVLVILSSLVSVAFNILHAPEGFLYQSMYALPPIVAVLSFEMVASGIRSQITPNMGIITPLETPADRPDKDLPHDLPVAVSYPEPGVSELPRSTRGPEVLRFFTLHPGSSQSDAAGALGLTRQGVRYHLTRMIQTGELLRIGDLIYPGSFATGMDQAYQQAVPISV